MRYISLVCISLIILLMGIRSIFAQTTETITLEQSLTEAARNSARLRASAEQLAAQRAAANDASGARLPTLSASGSYAYTSEVPELEVGPVKKTLGDGNVFDFNLTARAPLFAGGSLAERARAEQSLARAAEHDMITESLRLAHDVRRAFFNALGAAKREETAQQSVSRLSRHFKELRGAKEAGMASDEMIIQAESRLRQAEASALGTEMDARVARMTLANLVGRPGQQISPAEELETSLVPAEIVAEESRADVAAINARIEQTQHLTRAAKGGFFPMLSAQAAYHYGKPGVDQFKNNWMDYGTVGVNLTWTLWDWNSRSAKVAQARAGIRNLEARRDELLDAINTRLVTTRENVNAARAVLDKTTERMELERRRFELVQGRYRVGTSSESEFLDAQDDLTAAELDRSAAAVRLRLTEADYLNAAGR